LRRERVRVHENFFEAGGHSLLATRVVSRLRETLSVDLPLRALFDKPTPTELAAVVRERLQRRAGEESPPPLEPVGRSGPMELSFAQARLWFLNQLEPSSPFYNVPMGALLEGRLDIDALRHCLDRIVQRHEVLQASYRIENGAPVQVVDAQRTVPFKVIDISALSPEEQGAASRRLLEEEARRVFDLAYDPLLRALLLRLGQERHTVLLVMHHIVSDGWSLGVLIQELCELYRSYVENRQPSLAPLRVQYADYAAWQRRFLQDRALERQLDYWRERLAGAPHLALPVDHPRPAVARFRGSSVRFELSAELSQGLRALSRREGVTLFMTLLAAFDALLSWKTGQQDIVVGTDIANRIRAETEGLIGFFANQLVLRLDLANDPTFSELLSQVRKVTLDAYAHQDVPFDVLVRAINPQRDGSRMPLFQVKLVLQNAPLTAIDLPGVSVQPFPIETGTAKYDLLLTIEDASPLWGTLDYDADLFEQATIEQLVAQYRALLERAVAAPDAKLHELWALLTETGQRLAVDRERELRKAGLRKLRSIRRNAGKQ
jgi:hypothetical protein